MAANTIKASQYSDRLQNLHNEVDNEIHSILSTLKRADFWWEEDDCPDLDVEEGKDMDALFELPGAVYVDKHHFYEWLYITRITLEEEKVVYFCKSDGETNLDSQNYSGEEILLHQKIKVLELLQDGEYAQAQKKVKN